VFLLALVEVGKRLGTIPVEQVVPVFW